MYIITGGILVMVAVVFLAPQKQNKTEEKASSHLDEIDSIILKKYGDDLTPEEKEWARQSVAEDLARDKAEMRKYGRILTPDERSEQWWREQDEDAERAAYAKLYEERKDWIDNFPFSPGYHPDILYDPENIAHSDAKYRAYREERQKKREEAEARYDRETHEIWSMGDEMTTDEKHAACKKLRIEKEKEAAGKLDPEIEEQRRVILRHKQLAGFYEQNYRYAPEFEQAYRIFEEKGIADNPIRLAHTMVGLEGYFVTKRQASQHDLNELHPFQTRRDPKTRQTHRITWREQLERDFYVVRNCVRSEWVAEPGEERPSMELAERIRDRLIAEISPDGFTGQTFLFGLMDPKDEDMVPGQSLLAE